MKKKVLALSIAAMIGGVAHAGVAIPVVAEAAAAGNANVAVDATNASTLNVSADGIGHILLVPYFSTNNGNSTLLSLVNTDTVRGKAVKVRFRSAANSDDIFDFQVYMSPGDVWTANVSQGADGRSTLATSDKTCTLPFNVNQSFITDRLPPAADAATKAAWTREGYVEIFNMADIIDDTASTTDLFTAVKHVNGVAPCASAGFNWTKLQSDVVTGAGNSWNLASNGINFRAPTTGLAGAWTIINVQGASVAWSGNMTAIRAEAGGNAAAGRIVFSPQMASAAATPNLFTSDPLLRTSTTAATETAALRGDVHGAIGTAGTAILQAANFDLPDLSTPYLTEAALDTVALGAAVPTDANTFPIAQANMVSGALAVASVMNEYLTDTAITAATDWTFSMPTRRYGVAVNYASTATNKRVYTKGNQYFRTGNTSFSNNLICVAANTLTSFDREERFPTAGFVISPGTPSTLEFCGEVSVLSFNSTNVLGASLATKNIDATYRDGWLSVATPGLGAFTGAGATSNVDAAAAGRNGLPILGAAFVKATGPIVAGKSTNFGLTNGHRFTR